MREDIRRPPHRFLAAALGGLLLVGPLLADSLLAETVTTPRIHNPDLYKKSFQAAHQAHDFFGEYDDATERRRVGEIGYRLAAAARFNDFPFTFYLVEMPVPNAFALPGGQIFVTRGMLDLGLTDDMLANLLGHELAHVIYRHGMKMQRRAMILNLLSTAALLGVMVGASDEPENPYGDPYARGSRKGSLVQGTAAASVAISELLLRDYSRDFEDEADEEGQRLAAAAGFDPAGAHQLWRLMNARIPTSRAYGYWRTHPFSDLRMQAAEVRARELKILDGPSPEPYRKAAQKLILDFADGLEKLEEEERLFYDLSAKNAWPQGPAAERIRLAELHRERDAELEKVALQRDYGALARAYEEEIEEVRVLTPESPFIETLEGERQALLDAAQELYPEAVEVWSEGVYQTPFLETFLSNYPDAPQAPAVALALGNAYSRLGRQTEAVEQYLRAAEAADAPTEDAATKAPAESPAQKAIAGLRQLAPFLDQLAALETLTQIGDPELASLAEKRLEEMAGKYKDIQNGAEYLERFPESGHSTAVEARLETLADNLYGEVVLYQGVGDHAKALDRIQKILTHAPYSTAAELLRERAVFDS